MIPDDVVERVREEADIVQIVGEFVKLKRVGNSYRGPCPFHQGTHDNFAVSPKGGYICFVCGEKGDVFFHLSSLVGTTFEQLHEGQAVDYECEQDRRGPRATSVKAK